MAGSTFLSTGIGGLPFGSVDAALDHVFERYTVPFFPQLPALAHAELVPMLAEATTPAMQKALLDRDGKAFTKALEQACASPEAALNVVHCLPASSEFLDRLGPDTRFKVQHVGPATSPAPAASCSAYSTPVKDGSTWRRAAACPVSSRT